MDIPELPVGWEKKALIVVGVVFIITVIYAFNPFPATPTNNSTDQSIQTGTPFTLPKLTSTSKNTANNTDNNKTNITLKLTAEQAKNIAIQKNPGYTPGNPLQGTITVNNTSYNVWIVPLTKKNEASKTIYIDGNTGVIVLET